MPTKCYREGFLKKLEDQEYASLYVETALEETIKDGDIRAFQSALNNVLEAAEKRQKDTKEIYLGRQCVYRELLSHKALTIEIAEAALKQVGIVPHVEPSRKNLQSPEPALS